MITLKFNQINSAQELAGIYMIRNIINGHKYIGSTNNFICRGQKKTAFGFKWRYNYDK